MTDYPSLELCRELYKLKPEWGKDLEQWFKFGTHLGEQEKWGIGRSGEFPAYSLTWLLDKLPTFDMSFNGLIYSIWWEGDTIGYAIERQAKTAPDAACTLLITLVKEGVV